MNALLTDLPLFMHAPQSDLEDRFQRFCADNPDVYAAIARAALARLTRGERRISIKAIYEELRPHVRTNGAPYRLNNSYTGMYARRLVRDYPALRGVIELREREPRRTSAR